MNNELCLYFQAQVNKSDTWFVTATLRSFEHLAFDRTLDKETGLFEFFVPPSLKNYFLDLMEYYKKQGLISNLIELPNRLSDSNSQV